MFPQRGNSGPVPGSSGVVVISGELRGPEPRACSPLPCTSSRQYGRHTMKNGRVAMCIGNCFLFRGATDNFIVLDGDAALLTICCVCSAIPLKEIHRRTPGGCHCETATVPGTVGDHGTALSSKTLKNACRGRGPASKPPIPRLQRTSPSSNRGARTPSTRLSSHRRRTSALSARVPMFHMLSSTLMVTAGGTIASMRSSTSLDSSTPSAAR